MCSFLFVFSSRFFVCFKDVFERVVGGSTNRAIAMYQFHDESMCSNNNVRYVIESTDDFSDLLENNSNFFREICDCPDKTGDSFCHSCVDGMWNSVVDLHNKEYGEHPQSTNSWCLGSMRVDTDTMWSGTMAYETAPPGKCTLLDYKDYSLFTFDYSTTSIDKL